MGGDPTFTGLISFLAFIVGLVVLLALVGMVISVWITIPHKLDLILKELQKLNRGGGSVPVARPRTASKVAAWSPPSEE
jgi:hypothetical protein